MTTERPAHPPALAEWDHMKTLEEALSHLLGRVNHMPTTERIGLSEAHQRVLASAIQSPIDVPGFDNSAMDGYACRLDAEGIPLPVSQRIAAGDAPSPLAPDSVARIFTGAPLPEGAQAVVMQERTSIQDDGRVVLSGPIELGQFIRRTAGDLSRGQALFPVGHLLQSADVALLASVGLSVLEVFRPLRVGVFSSGDELRQPGSALAPGQIYDSNRPMIMSLVRALGAQASDLGCLPDALETTRAALREAGQAHDVLITCGGVSVGEEDHMKAAVSAEGALDLWKIMLRPGRPFAFGRVRDATFIGLPGNPVSAWVTFALLVRPYLLRASGQQRVEPESLLLESGFDWPHPDARREFLRGWIDASGRLAHHPRQDSQVLSSICESRGLIEIPPGQPVCRGDRLRYIPFTALLSRG